MIRVPCFVSLACLLSLPLIAQQRLSGNNASAGGGEIYKTQPSNTPAGKPFSHLAIGGGIGSMGINLQAATNINRYTNLRVSGNTFNYTVDDISSNGFTATGKLDFATVGASFDYYPWPAHGFRLSPGYLFYNQNNLTATAVVNGAESFTLNDVAYYSSRNDPIHARAKLGLNSTRPAFTMTTGWGNMISRRGGHWSFPFEIGAALVGSPSFEMSLSGTACDQTGQKCLDAATNPDVQSNLQAQIDKYNGDVDALKVFPILSVGVSYNFNILRTR